MADPAYFLSDAQWRALFDLYQGAMIITMRKATMQVLERKHLVTRKETHERWQLSKAGRAALKSAPRQWNPHAPFSHA
jgi:hypothetical protein